MQAPGMDEQDDEGLGAQPPHVDPRQGTLLGFELPESLLLSLTATGARNDAPAAEPEESERAVQAEGAGVEEAAAIAVGDATVDAVVDERPVTDRLPDFAETTIGTDKPVAADTRVAAEKPAAGRKGARAEKPIMLATSGAPAAPASAALSKARRPEAQAPSAAVFLETESLPPASPESTALIKTVASLEAAFVQERHAAEARWRRTRHWLALALAGLALLLAVCIGQIVAFSGFADRSQAAQQQMQSALTEQQAALAGLASATAALSAATQTPEAPDAASAASAAPQPAKHTRPAHLRHAKEKARAAAR
jgi:hypothetical protein